LQFKDKHGTGNEIRFGDQGIGYCRNTQYKIVKNLGEGGQGYTLLCKKDGGESHGKLFVVKIAESKRFKQVPDLAEREQAGQVTLEAMAKEYTLGSRCEHDNVIAYYGLGQD